MGYPAMGMGVGSPRIGGPPMGMGDGMGPPGMGGPMGMGGPRGGMDGSMGGMGGGPLGMGGSGGMGGGPMSARGPGGMRGRPGGMPPPDMGEMQRPGGMMGGPPQGMNGMSDLPPRYSAPPPGQNPYAFGPPSVSSRSSATARPPRRPPGAHKHIPMGAYAAQSPRISRSHTSPTTAERIHRKTTGDSGKEWIKGDDFLDACICTTGCTCREGHRVLYRSRDDGGDSDGEGRYGSGEIRYILKKDLGKDCGDHSGCKRNDSEKEEKISKKEKKKEEKRRKEELQNLKDDMLEALDERLGAWRKAKSSKAGSVSSPRPPFAGLGGPMGMGMDPNAMMNDPVMAQKLASMGLGPLMPMPPNMTVGGGHPYAMQAGIPGLSKMQAGMMDPQQQMGIRPGQMPMGMSYEDEISIADMEGVGLGNQYLGREARGRGPQPRFVDPTSRRENGMTPKPMPFSAVRRGAGGRQRKLLHSQQQQTRRDFGSDEYDSPAPRPTGRAGSFHDDKDDAGDRDERDGPGLAATRIALPRDKAGRSSRDQKQPRIDSDHDEDYE
ncbi:hypothetical protein HBI62_202650 [Parastagonospora nodorum]|nr:hypothetical protein HBI62_202650 [Parastagonospora nodorum]KAH6142126.1 hypothetical protein HBI63_195310 [Parastagonospora nodorum]KAH6169746.1 hypothetical protein HBI61_192990 [Parastagonospora nodorum]